VRLLTTLSTAQDRSRRFAITFANSRRRIPRRCRDAHRLRGILEPRGSEGTGGTLRAWSKRGVFGGQNKQVLDLYSELFAGLAQRPADGFPHLFTEAFGKAYEAKLRVLNPPRRSSFGAEPPESTIRTVKQSAILKRRAAGAATSR